MSLEDDIERGIVEGIETVLFKLGNLKSDESLCIITDDESSKIAKLFHRISNKHKIKTEYHTIENLKIHGQEPPNNIANAMKNCNLILGLTTNSMAHTKARLNATNLGIRFLSLPNYTIDNKNVKVYCCDPSYNPAAALIKNLIYERLAKS